MRNPASVGRNIGAMETRQDGAPVNRMIAADHRRHRGFLTILGHLEGRRPPGDLLSVMMCDLPKGVWHEEHFICKYAEGTYIAVSLTSTPSVSVFIERTVHLPAHSSRIQLAPFLSTIDSICSDVMGWLGKHSFCFRPSHIRTDAIRKNWLEDA